PKERLFGMVVTSGKLELTASAVVELALIAAPVGMPWLWTLAYGHHEDRTPIYGYEPTRAAAKTAFAASTAIIWVKCFRETGRCTAKPRGGSVSPLEKHADFLLGLIARRPDLTLDEAVLAMHRHKIPGSRSAMWRFFKRHNVTFKKKPARGGAGARGRGASAPALDARTGHV